MSISGKYLNKKDDNISNIRYIFNFLTKSFMYSIISFLFIVLFTVGFYFCDLLFNINKNINNVPLFNAYVIVSKSMIPTIKVNDAVVIKRKMAEKLKLGDIITFSSADPSYTGLTVTHRIVGKQLLRDGNYVFRTKGDNNLVEDPSLVDENNIFGKVIFKIPCLGRIRDFLSSPFGFFLGIFIPSLLIIMFFLYKYLSNIKKSNIEII